MSLSKPCRLLAIPPELRNHIYSLLLSSSTTIRVTHEGITRPRPCKLVFPNEDPSHQTTNIIATNRQVQQEAAAILYGNNTFLFVSTRALTVFLAHVSRSARCLRSVTLDALDCERDVLRFSANMLTQVTALSCLTIRVSRYYPDEAPEIASGMSLNTCRCHNQGVSEMSQNDPHLPCHQRTNLDRS